QGGLLSLYASAIGDSVNFFWDRYILTFGLADQLRLFVDNVERARDALHSVKLRVQPVFTMHAAAIAAAMMAVVALVYLFAWQRRPAFALLREHLARRGIEVSTAMTMEEALARLPESDAAQLAPLIALYERERFSASPPRGVRAEIRKRLWSAAAMP